MFEFLKRLFGHRGTVAMPPTQLPYDLEPARQAANEAAAPADDLGATILYRRPVADDETHLHSRRNAHPAAGEAICLIVLAGGQNRFHFDVPPEGAYIGRSPDCALKIADPRVSAKHAWIGTVDGLPVIRDLGSTNGTFLNAGTHSLGNNTPLEIGDTILLGGHYGVQLRVARAQKSAA